MTQGQCQTTRKSHIFDILFDLISKLFSCISIIISIYWNDKMTVSVLTMSRISNNNKKLANPDTKKIIFNLKLIFMKILREKIYWGANQSVQKLRKFFFELLKFFPCHHRAPHELKLLSFDSGSKTISDCSSRFFSEKSSVVYAMSAFYAYDAFFTKFCYFSNLKF